MMAVRMSRFCRLALPEKAEECSTIFSSSSMSGACFGWWVWGGFQRVKRGGRGFGVMGFNRF